MIIFEYYPCDPNGWARHFLIGIILCLLFRRWALPIALLLAVGKEVHDAAFSFYAALDIVFTVLPALLVISIKKYNIFDLLKIVF